MLSGLLTLTMSLLAAFTVSEASNAIGLSIISLNTPAMQKTTEFQPGGTGEYFKYGDLALDLPSQEN